ncbi:MAG: hypothetical protein ACJ79J_11840 [Gemmatimonadaceae bacterium]|jgi:hypothetical protein
MSEVLVKFDEPIMNPRGEMFFAEAVGRMRDSDGLWEGWIRFDGIDDSSRHISSERETTQPNRADLEYWAQGLTVVYLQGALSRAETSSRSLTERRGERPFSGFEDIEL